MRAALIIALRDEDASMRKKAADALGELGSAAKDAIPALTKVLKDEDKDVRDAAQTALAKIKAAK